MGRSDHEPAHVERDSGEPLDQTTKATGTRLGEETAEANETAAASRRRNQRGVPNIESAYFG
jgi:hypothetical protein